MKTQTQSAAIDLPLEIKERLVLLAKKLPEAAQSEFVRQATKRLSEIAADHPRTIVFTAAGWVLGELIDNILTIDLPFSDVVVCLTADKAGDIGGVAGALYGFFEDKQRQSERRQIAKIIGEELRSANASRA